MGEWHWPNSGGLAIFTTNPAGLTGHLSVMSAPALALLVVRDAVSRISPIETIEELRQLLFDLPDDIAVEINADNPDLTRGALLDILVWATPFENFD